MTPEEVTFVSGRTRIFGIVGHPIEQVRSPEMFTAEFIRRGGDALLIPIHVLPQDFSACVTQLKRMQNLGGLIFTIPYKQTGMAMADAILPQGRAVGAINALARQADGTWTGEMFDGIGCVEGFRRRGYPLHGQRVLLIGAGGAGSAIGVAIAFENPRSIQLYDPDAARAAELVRRIRGVNPAVEVRAPAAPAMGDIDVLLNASPVGMLEDPRTPVDISGIASSVIVFDAIVKPERTRLLQAAEERGCRTVYGREMMRGQMGRVADFFGYPERPPPS